MQNHMAGKSNWCPVKKKFCIHPKTSHKQKKGLTHYATLLSVKIHPRTNRLKKRKAYQENKHRFYKTIKWVHCTFVFG